LFFLLLGVGVVVGLCAMVFIANNKPVPPRKFSHSFGEGKQPIVSSDYKTQAEKIAVLKTRLNLPKTVQATEFSLFEATFIYLSTNRYHVALKMRPSEIDSWMRSITYLPWESGKNYSELHVEGDQFFKGLLNAPTWKHTSKPEYFQSVENMDTHNAAIIYRKEGIILLSLEHSTT